MEQDKATAGEIQEAREERGVMPTQGSEIVLLSKRDKTERLSKSYELDASGNLKSTPAPDLFSDLTAQRIYLDAREPLTKLAKVINGMKPHHALAMGRLPAGVPDRTEVPVVFAGQVGKCKHGTDWVHRTGQDFTHAKGVPAPALLDFDVKDYPEEIAERVEALGGPLEALLDAVPELRDVKMVVRPSTSSGIRRMRADGTGTGDPFTRGGLHVYLMLADGSDAPRVLKTIQDRLWEKGLGFHKIAKNGTPIKASIIDASVGRPERPCYEAPPALGAGLVQDARPAALRDGTVTFFDSHGLAAADADRVRALVRADLDRPKVQERIKVAEDAYLGARVAKGVPLRAAQASLNSLRLGKLPLDTEVILTTPMRGKRSITVLDLLEDPQAFDGKPMADPVEGPGYGSQTAKFFANDGRPKINTMAHGGGLYDLSGYGPQDALAAVLSGLALDRVVRVLKLPYDDVRAVLRALDAEGTKVDARLREKALGWGMVASLSRRAQNALDFGLYPPEPMPAGFEKGLEAVAAGEKTDPEAKDVQAWLETQKKALAAREDDGRVVLLDAEAGDDGVARSKLFNPFGRVALTPIPLDVFPPALRRHIEERAEAIGVETCGIAGALLGAASGAIHGAVRLDLKPGWDTPPALWIALVGDVSAKKTPIFNLVTKQMQNRTVAAIQQHNSEWDQWQRDNKGKGQKGPVPVWRDQLTSSDSTVEGLGYVLSQQDRGICVTADELVVFIEGLGAYKQSGGGKDVGKMLSAFNGEREAINRASGGANGGPRSIAIENWLVSVIGGIQPAKLAKLDEKVARNGLLERFLPVMLGKARAPTTGRFTNPDLWDDMVDVLVGTWPQRFSLGLDATLVHDDACAFYARFPEGTFDDGVVGAVGKLSGVVGRLALILHYLDHAQKVVLGETGGLIDTEVSDDVMERAVRLTKEWIIPAQIAFWASMSGGNAGLHHIARYLLRDDGVRYVPRDFMRGVKALSGKSGWEIARAVAPLEACGWLIPDTQGNLMGRYSWTLDPRVRVQFAKDVEDAKWMAQEAKELFNALRAQPSAKPDQPE